MKSGRRIPAALPKMKPRIARPVESTGREEETRPSSSTTTPPPAGSHPRKRPDWRFLPAWRQQALVTAHKLEGDGGWAPRRKLSPAAQAGIRTLFHSDRERYTVRHLSEVFKVSPDAVRRIVKSSWVPSPQEAADREARWKKRMDERRAQRPACVSSSGEAGKKA